MKGLYVNTAPEKSDFYKNFDMPFSVYAFPERTRLPGQVVFDHREWMTPPAFELPEENIFSVCCGWFIYKNTKNDIADLTKDFLRLGPKILEDISAGIFVLLIKKNDLIFIITDPFGLANHYYRKIGKQWEIAPSPFFFGGEKTIDPVADSILQKEKHLFGDMTRYKDIKRLNPATVYSDTDIHVYYQPRIKSFHSEEVSSQINKFANFWPYENRAIALSGGLDSRLILASTDIRCGYTYGPPNSADRPVARSFAHKFGNYQEVSLEDIGYFKKDHALVESMVDGTILSPLHALLPIYRHVGRLFGSTAHVMFDGFLGDVFQRGTFSTIPKSLPGFLLKLAPGLTARVPVETILKMRYPFLSATEHDLLVESFQEKTRHLSDMDELHKLTYYEICFGHGARYASTGAILMNSQFFTVAPPFLYLPLFENIFSADMIDTLNFRTLQSVWRNVDKRFSSVPTESLYRPDSSPTAIKTLRLLKRIYAKTICRGKYDYADQIRKIVWH